MFKSSALILTVSHWVSWAVEPHHTYIEINQLLMVYIEQLYLIFKQSK